MRIFYHTLQISGHLHTGLCYDVHIFDKVRKTLRKISGFEYEETLIGGWVTKFIIGRVYLFLDKVDSNKKLL